MPPAFNLSQDQTLQFDLDLLSGIEVNFTSNIRERLRSLDLTNTFLYQSGTFLQTPTLIGCMFLKNLPDKLNLSAPTIGWQGRIFELNIETLSRTYVSQFSSLSAAFPWHLGAKLFDRDQRSPQL